MALAIALLPLHASLAKPVQPAIAAAADLGDCHGKAAPDRPDLGGPSCQHCGACHAVQTVTAEPLLLPGHVAMPAAALSPVLRGMTLQPDLHPPLA